jgi:carbamoyl-phosphate synthase large subunit
VNTLFTSAGRRVELLRAFNRAYNELSLAGHIVAIDRDPLAPALREASAAYIVPPVSDRGYVDAIVRICQAEDIDLVFPLIDREIPVLARSRSLVEATGALLVVAPADAVSTTADKLATYHFFRSLQVPVPKTWRAEEARGAIDRWPVFVKPRFGSAGKDAVTCRSSRELEFFLEYVPNPIVQEFLPGPEITSDVVSGFDGTVLAVASRRRIEVRAGEVAKGVTIYDAEILRHCVTIARGLSAIGPITIQCILREGEPFFTEVNARFGGGAPLAIAAGVRSPHWLLALAAGRDAEIPALGTYEVGLYVSRFDDSLLMTREECARVASRRL